MWLGFLNFLCWNNSQLNRKVARIIKWAPVSFTWIYWLLLFCPISVSILSLHKRIISLGRHRIPLHYYHNTFTKIRKFNNDIILSSNPVCMPSLPLVPIMSFTDSPTLNPTPVPEFRQGSQTAFSCLLFTSIWSPLIWNPNMILKTLSLWHRRTRRDRGRGWKQAKKEKNPPL